MNPTHHLNRSRLYLQFTQTDVAAGDYARAACALCRSASHAVTAAAVHWHHPHSNRRRLNYVMIDLTTDGLLAFAHYQTFKEVYDVPAQVADACPAVARRLLRRVHRRVARLIVAVEQAMSSQPNPMTLEQAIAQAEERLNSHPPLPVVINEAVGGVLRHEQRHR